MIVFVTSCVTDDTEIHALLFVLTAAILLNERGRPYESKNGEIRRKRLHNLDGNAIYMVYVTAWTGFFFKLTPHCEKDHLFCQALEWSVAVLELGRDGRPNALNVIQHT